MEGKSGEKRRRVVEREAEREWEGKSGVNGSEGAEIDEMFDERETKARSREKGKKWRRCGRIRV